MKTKNFSIFTVNLKLFLVLPVIAVALIAFSSCGKNKISEVIHTELAPPPTPTQSLKSEEVPFVVVEEMPMFPGGDRALLDYISENTIYPEASKAQNIQGRVIIRFCVTAKGGVSLVSVIKGVAPELDAEAVRVVKTLPTFNPGKQGGKSVPVWYMVPITFTLK